MNTPLISICIPTYNGQQFLEACLDSAIGQTYRNIEIIVVDDCSTDRTYEIVKKYEAKDARIKLFRNEKNIGLVANWNRCMEFSAGEWIKFLFQDDYLTPDCVEVMVNALVDNDKIVASTRRRILEDSIDTNEGLTFEKLGIISKSPVFISPKKISLLAVQNICLNFMGEPTVIMFKKEIIKELGIFNPDLIQICDLEYFLRIATNYGIRYVPQPLSYFRVHKGSTSSSNISERMFSINNIDPVIMVHQLLYGTFFNHFREALSTYQKIKLKLFFTARVHESYKVSLDSTPENRNIFETSEKKYPMFSQFKKGTPVTSILLDIVRLRRLLKKKG